MASKKLGRPVTSSQARKVYQGQSKKISQMLNKHIDGLSRKRGRRPVLDPVSRSAIVFMCAAWQVYAEDVAKEVARFMVDNTQSFESLPDTVQKEYLKAVEGYCKNAYSRKGPFGAGKSSDECHESMVRAFSRLNELDEGNWKRFDNDISRINTPNSDNVLGFFKEWFSIDKQDFRKKEVDSVSIGKIDEVLDLRHKVAHGADIRELEGVEPRRARECLDVIDKIVEGFDDSLGRFLYSRFGSSPWGYYTD